MKKIILTTVVGFVFFIPVVSFACERYNVGVAEAKICGNLQDKVFTATIYVAGIEVAHAGMTPYYINEGGQRENDNSYFVAKFPIKVVQVGTYARIKIRILHRDRNDRTIFQKKGDVIYAQAIWRLDHAPKCAIPKPSKKKSSCWDESGWRHIGRL